MPREGPPRSLRSRVPRASRGGIRPARFVCLTTRVLGWALTLGRLDRIMDWILCFSVSLSFSIGWSNPVHRSRRIAQHPFCGPRSVSPGRPPEAKKALPEGKSLTCAQLAHHSSPFSWFWFSSSRVGTLKSVEPVIGRPPPNGQEVRRDGRSLRRPRCRSTGARRVPRTSRRPRSDRRWRPPAQDPNPGRSLGARG